MAADSMMKASTPEPVGPGPLWKHAGWHLPDYIQHVANDLRAAGHPESRAIAMAVGIVKNWADGHDGKGKPVHPDTVAAARKAIAEWEALKAAAGSGKKLAAPRQRDAVELAGPPAAVRKRAAARGMALPGGRFPILNTDHLRNAVRAVGRGSGSHDSIRRFIVRRARALNAMHMIPANWNADGSLKGGSS